MDWINLDAELRGTGADPQALADRRGLVVIADADAACVGACWFGTPVAAAGGRAAAVADYVASGGTASQVYAPRAG